MPKTTAEQIQEYARQLINCKGDISQINSIFAQAMQLNEWELGQIKTEDELAKKLIAAVLGHNTSAISSIAAELIN